MSARCPVCNRPIIDPEHAKRLTAMWTKGTSRSKIAAELGMSGARVSQIAKRLGLLARGSSHDNKPNPKRNEAMIAAFQKGDTLNKLSDRYGITRQRVHQIVGGTR
jgi:hypothetical protein